MKEKNKYEKLRLVEIKVDRKNIEEKIYFRKLKYQRLKITNDIKQLEKYACKKKILIYIY